MSRVLLRLERVGKDYPPTVQARGRVRAFWQVLLSGRSRGGKRVLEDINLEVRAGESMGIIGANGAGKSTLLKIITGVLQPSTGTMAQQGTRAALLELGAGFNPEYSGLDNLRMNAAFLGMSQRQVDQRLDDIISFADIGQAINEPVKHYSSGMVVRLGFAVIASVKPDLLITDEVLAVGDESFQKKCIRWIEQYLAEGGTLLMVSHSMYQVQKLCHQAMWLENGRAREMGDVFDVTQAYLAWHERLDAERSHVDQGNAGAYYGVDEIRIEQADDDDGPPLIPMGGRLVVTMRLRSPDGRRPVAAVGLVRADGTPVYGVTTDFDDYHPGQGPEGQYLARVVFDDLSLLPGGYAVRGHALDPEGLRLHDTAELDFTVTGRSRELGLVRLQHRWEPVEPDECEK